ncbi:MAG: alpha/beta hydrolase, partial [Actinomycetota bacterium]|nr:alpha/beta hydrolase [Actinomycetota bacterium]
MSEQPWLSTKDPTPVRQPDRSGAVDRGGVRITYSVYGAAGPTLLLMPTWAIVHSLFWKGQIGYLARHYRVVTFDGRGSGDSDRPVGAEAYRDEEYAADALAVLDATETDRAVAVSLSSGVMWSLHLAADHPDRVAGLVAIGAVCSFPVGPQARKQAWASRLDTTEGWAKYNRHYLLEGGYDDFVEFFFGQVFSEPRSTKQAEDSVRWAHQTTPQVVADSTDGRMGHGGASTPAEEVARRVQCPVLAIHGTDDQIRPPAISERLVELTGGELILLEGCGHSPGARDPVKVNHLIKKFADTIYPRPEPGPRHTWVRAQSRPKKALYLSSPIGLGHARRDLAIAAELRKHHPDLQIDWLAQPPVTRVLDDAGETVHPASSWLANESKHIEDESGEHDLHVFQAFRRMDQILVNNFHVFNDVVD